MRWSVGHIVIFNARFIGECRRIVELDDSVVIDSFDGFLGDSIVSIHSWDLDGGIKVGIINSIIIDGFNVADEPTLTVGKNKLLGLIFAEKVDSVNDGLGQRDDVPTAASDLLARGEVEKAEAT
jgi:hypothetical protein